MGNIKSWLFKIIAGKSHKFKPRKKLRFEVEIAGHCNLNCKNCSHFSPLVKEEFVHIETLERDFARLSFLAGRNNERIKLLGGEPLLHPRLNEIMEMTRKYFDGPVYLNTNGLLLARMNDEFWAACKKSRITVLVSNYPVKLNKKLIREKGKRHGVKILMRRFSGERTFAAGAHSWSRCQLDSQGKQDAVNNYKVCFMNNSCIFLRDGKISTCCLPPTVYRFNEHFGENIEVSENNFIDIHKAKSIQEIYEFVVKPIPFCRYCKVSDWTYGIEWGISKKDKSEWADEA